MKIIGIVSEYNPFHLGHYHQLEESKKQLGADGVIALMSGSITQRGEFAFINKWKRTRLALESGIDLIFELPVVYSAQSAEYFASGAIRLFNLCGLVNHLSFGSESGEIESLKKLAALLAEESPAFKQQLKSFLKEGHSFARSRELTVETFLGSNYSRLLNKPNNILSIEYLKALYRSNSSIKPITIKRKGAGYHSLEDSDYLSATAIRKLILENQNRETAFELLKNKLPYSPKLLQEMTQNININGNAKFLDALRFAILNEDIHALKNFPYVSEGLEHKIRDQLKTATSYNDLINGIVSKRMPRTRVQRILTNRIINLAKPDLEEFNSPSTPPYLRILGFNETGQELLKQIKKNSQVPVINNMRKTFNKLSRRQQLMLSYDIRASDLQNLFFEKDYCYHRDYSQNPIRYFKNCL